MSIREHLQELRTRMLRCLAALAVSFFMLYFFVDTLFAFITAPLALVLPDGSSLIYTGMADGLLVEIRLVLLASFLVTCPFIFYQIWAFIAPGLYHEEKRHILPLAGVSAFFFILGMAFCYYIALPYAFAFFMSYSRGVLKAAPSVREYLTFTINLLFSFGLIFEMPLFSFFLAKLGILNAAFLRKWRRYAIVLAFIVAAFLTPPDVISQVLMAVPLLLLYELSIWTATLARRGKNQP